MALRKLKLAIACHPTQGGSGIVATELAIALADRGHDVHLVAVDRPFRLPEKSAVRYHPVNIPDYPLFRYPPHDLCLSNKLAEIAVDHDLDIVHAHYAVPHAVSAILARQITRRDNLHVVTTVHGTDITLVGSHKDFFGVCRYAMVEADRLTAVSHWLADKTAETFDLETRPTVITNFVDCDRFCAKGRSGLPRSKPVRILHASNFRPVKRVTDIIRVFAGIASKIDAELYMVGDGPERRWAEELAGELQVGDRVQFLGPQKDMGKLYRSSHLFMLISDYESFGLSALEAMACGTPVLASRSGGLTEVVEDHETGRLCQVGDITSMVDAAYGVLRDPPRWKAMSEQAAERARDVFCVEKIIPQYEQMYRAVLDAE